MDEREEVAARMGLPFSRRAVLGRAIRGGLGATAAALLPGVSSRALADDAALFGGVRHQFTLLRPVRVVPPVSLMRVNGSAIDFASLRGKVVLVNFWATWCPACRSELPALERLQIALGGTGFDVVAISVDRDGAAAVKPFLSRLNIRRLPVYLDAGGRTWSRDGDGGAPFVLYGMPISYLVDPEGRIQGYLAGDADWASDQARTLISSYMRQPAQ